MIPGPVPERTSSPSGPVGDVPGERSAPQAWPSSVVVAVGDELLSGRTVDGNGAWLGTALAEAGVPVIRRFTVGDLEPDIGASVSQALSLAELVVVTGGLGPTHDDRTLEAVAELLGRDLDIDQGLVDSLTERFRRRGFQDLPPSNLKQARVPRGGVVLHNRRGTAPGILLSDRGRHVVLLPGVPGEMVTLMEEEVIPRLEGLFPSRLRPVRVQVLRTTGVAESQLAGLVDPIRESVGFPPVDVAFLPRVTGVELRLSRREGDGDALSLLREAADRLSAVVAPWLYRGPDLVDDLARALLDSGRTVATAESCTGGLLGQRLTDRPGSSTWYLGGVVAYANEVKRDLLGIDAGLLEAEGAVSRAVALGMARGIAARLGASAGIGITGVAGPGGGSREKPVGTVWIAASLGEVVEVRREVFPGDRADVRERSAQAAIHLLLRMVGGS